eukprot:CAMPEP_0198144422 /NCGR_PEP_ID=MMETSP1443-20131203/15577_1 /TAXON_ID=186043 /ORGANISM="Entomoneis sp., Strain CCMP2396" /LENGTH=230 /DNA_ID=CAMNT_0043807813 /DNA_START=18 /DNA_END=707 /DNA_ORIENTATION=+
MAALRNGFRLFHPSRHIWFRASPPSGSAGAAKNALQLEIGLTKRGLDDVGDVTLMRSMISSSDNNVSKGDSLLQIEWEGHSITSADELYHTVWESVSGTTNVETPVSGQVEHINIIDNTMCIEEDTVLAKLETTEAEWNSAMAKMVEELEYHGIVGKIPQGKFAEPEEEVVDLDCDAKAKELCTVVFQIIYFGSKEITYFDGPVFYMTPAQTEGISTLIMTVLQMWSLTP